MGLGQLFERNINITQTDTVTGQTITDVIVTGPNEMGAYPEWEQVGPYRGGMTVPPAYRAATLIADATAGMPWNAYREGPGGSPVEVKPKPQLLAKPAGREIRFATYASTVLDLLWHGNGIWLKTNDDDFGEPRAVLPIRAPGVGVKRIAEVDGLTTIPVGTEGYLIGGRWFHPDRVIHFKGICEPGGLVGVGLLELFLTGQIDLAIELRRQAASATGAGIPTGILTSDNPDLTTGEAATLKASWKTAQATRDVQVLNATTHFEPLAWNPTESQLLEARRFSHIEIAQIFGVDPSWLGAAQSSKTYSNVESEGISLVRFGGLAGVLERMAETLAMHLSPGTWVEPNRDSLMRADTLARYQAHQIAITSKFLTPNEVRTRFENLPPLTAEQQAELKALDPPPPAPAGGSPSSGRQGGGSKSDPSNKDAKRSDAAFDLKHDYWLEGEGLARWATSPKPWTTLYGLLRKHMTDEMAKRCASQWYFEHFGRWPSDG